MIDYSGKLVPIEHILKEISIYVTCVCNLKNHIDKISEYKYSGYQFIDNWSLEDMLLDYPTEEVILKLGRLLNSLKSINNSQIKREFPDQIKYNDITDSDEIVSMEDERQQLFQGIQRTQDFIQGIIDRRQKLEVTPTPKLFSYTGTNQQLISLKKALFDARLIDNTEYFVKIFKGKAPNERINWIGHKSHFCYFIKELFKEVFCIRADWEIVRNSFNFQGQSIIEGFDKNNGKLPNEQERIINSAIDYLKIE